MRCRSVIESQHAMLSKYRKPAFNDRWIPPMADDKPHKLTILVDNSDFAEVADDAQRTYVSPSTVIRWIVRDWADKKKQARQATEIAEQIKKDNGNG